MGMTGPGPEALAATSAALDILSSDRAGEAADTVDISSPFRVETRFGLSRSRS